MLRLNDCPSCYPVSKDTIRRDLIQLEKRQVLKRTHGGAVSTNPAAVIYDYQTRAGQFYDIKAKIAKAAISLDQTASLRLSF